MGRPVTFRFRAKANGLRRIDVQMTSRQRFSMSTVVVQVFDGDASGEPLAVQRIHGGHINVTSWVAVQIPMQPHSAGREYVVVVESPNGREGNSVAVQGRRQRAEGVTTQIAGELYDGSVCFQAYSVAPEQPEDVQRSDALSLTGQRELHRATRPKRADSGAVWDSIRTLQASLEGRLDGIEEQNRRDHEQFRLQQELMASRLALPLEGRVRRLLGRRNKRDGDA
jgi:hypothetical protein